jgi:hypothetical protein
MSFRGSKIGGRLMDRNEVEHVARVSGKEAAQETLIGLGIDTTKPIETQRDFAHLRWWREIAEGVMKAAVIAMALGFGGTLATLVWLGFKPDLNSKLGFVGVST